MQHAFQVIEGAPPATLPILANASDVREVVQLLKKKPEGITIVEASDAVRKRLFDPRKVAAYETWGIISRSGDRMKLSELGHQFASKLGPEAQIFRVMLDNTPPYRAVLEWIYQQDLDLVTYADIVDYWEDRFPEALQQGEKISEGQVISFLHLCHAGEIGTATVGRKHQPSRLRVDHDELAAYIESGPGPVLEEVFAEEDLVDARRPALPGAVVRKRLRVFISTHNESGVVGSIQDALQIMEIDSEVVERETDGAKLLSECTFQAMRRCAAGIIIVGQADCHHDATAREVLNQNTLIEIGAAIVHFGRRLVLLSDKQVALPFNLDDFYHYELEGNKLTWEMGLQLIKAVKLFETSSQLIDAVMNPPCHSLKQTVGEPK
jgi:hypothetical protein